MGNMIIPTITNTTTASMAILAGLDRLWISYDGGGLEMSNQVAHTARAQMKNYYSYSQFSSISFMDL
ncbi:MAG: hypothetical protein WBP64_18415 [Nitrososphaeraceae archaeon]